jgi:hypothetical protein
LRSKNLKEANMKQKFIIRRLSICVLIIMSFLLIGCFPLPRIVKKTVGGLGPEYPKEQIVIVKGSRHCFFIFPDIYISSTATLGRVDNQLYAYGLKPIF